MYGGRVRSFCIIYSYGYCSKDCIASGKIYAIKIPLTYKIEYLSSYSSRCVKISTVW